MKRRLEDGKSRTLRRIEKRMNHDSKILTDRKNNSNGSMKTLIKIVFNEILLQKYDFLIEVHSLGTSLIKI